MQVEYHAGSFHNSNVVLHFKTNLYVWMFVQMDAYKFPMSFYPDLFNKFNMYTSICMCIIVKLMWIGFMWACKCQLHSYLYSTNMVQCEFRCLRRGWWEKYPEEGWFHRNANHWQRKHFLTASAVVFLKNKKIRLARGSLMWIVIHVYIHTLHRDINKERCVWLQRKATKHGGEITWHFILRYTAVGYWLSWTEGRHWCPFRCKYTIHNNFYTDERTHLYQLTYGYQNV